MLSGQFMVRSCHGRKTDTMHFYDRPPTSTAQIRLHHTALAVCWAAVAFCQIAGIKTYANGGPAFAPRPAVVVIVRHNRFD
jgi:hypothetical protein